MMKNEQLNILLLGSGGREAAIERKLLQSPRCNVLYTAPGNAGSPNRVRIAATDFDAIRQFVQQYHIDMIVVGPEAPLVQGIYDFFDQDEVLVVGPSKSAAALEGSKEFAKGFMARRNIPTARYRAFGSNDYEDGCAFLRSLRPPYVLKADGLAAGKGVIILNDLAEAKKALKEMLNGMFGQASARVVIEEYLSGIECSVFVITDGNGGYRILPVAKDYKRIGEGDTGLNTGGMGAVSPLPFADSAFISKVEQRIIRPTIEGLRYEHLVYRGFIFFGLMNVDGNPFVIEYNVRMGDPETEVVMLRLQSDLVDLLEAAAGGCLGDTPALISPQAAATVVAVAAGYPGSYSKGNVIFGDLAPNDAIVFHAGTDINPDGRLVSAGGRVLAVSALADNLQEALNRAYNALKGIHFDGITYRKDIGQDILRQATS